MKKHMLAVGLTFALLCASVQAGQIGAFGSYWNQRDGDEAMGGGISYLFATLPLELRGTYYERSSARNVRASPIDFGLNLILTRGKGVNATALAGASYYFVDVPNGSVDNEFGWYLGGRMEMAVQGGTVLFGELLYRGADLDDANVNLSGIAINIGILF
ncbi:MAG TPA: hypothetical protein PJ991_10255 [Kiritimatiellia bacterium]|nr:hypothetical protein [Kiritimatiellia bacterium]